MPSAAGQVADTPMGVVSPTEHAAPAATASSVASPAAVVEPEGADQDPVQVVFRDPAVVKVATLLLLALAIGTFLAPTLLALILRLQTGYAGGSISDPAEWLAGVLPFFQGIESGPYSWLLQQWEAIPTVVAGAVLFNRSLRRYAALLTVVITFIVAVGSSYELYCWSQATVEAKRALAMAFGGDSGTNLANFEALFAQVHKTQDISIAFIAAVVGGSVVARRGGSA